MDKPNDNYKKYIEIMTDEKSLVEQPDAQDKIQAAGRIVVI